VTRSTEAECEWCGYPMYSGDVAYRSERLETIVCCRRHAERIAAVTENWEAKR